MVQCQRVRWTRDELLIVLNLYHKLRFGQFDSRQVVIVELATALGRTPGSVAMKLNNLASLDPVLKLRGVRGLAGASNLDREIWDEFHENPAEMAPLSQEKFDALFSDSEGETTDIIPGIGIFRRNHVQSASDVKAFTKQRRGQHYFREIVLNNYANRCAITRLPVRELLVASHILPWSSHEKERLNVRNGICLNRLHDAAFDQGLIGFDDELQMMLSPRILCEGSDKSVTMYFVEWETRILELPDDGLTPDLGFLAEHRKRFGFG